MNTHSLNNRSLGKKSLIVTLLGFVTLAVLALGIRPLQAAGIPVAAGVVAVAADGQCSLIEAIINANDDAQTHVDCNAGSGADTLILPPASTYNLTTSYATYGGDTGLPQITSDITIDGAGSTIARTAGNIRLLAVSSSGILTLNSLTLSAGNRPTDAGGGAIYNNGGSVIINDSTLRDNSASGSEGGGAIRTRGGSVVINRSTLTGNQASNSNGGGALYSTDNASVTINQSVLDNNITNNTSGGAITQVSGTITLNNSTISNNQSQGSGGGGIYAQGGTLNLNNVTVTGNSSTNAGGGLLNNGAIVNLNRSIIAGNTAPSYTGSELVHYSGTTQANNYNVFGHSGLSNTTAFAYGFTPGANDFNATTNGTPTALASILDTTLTNNGGSTQTHALVSGSPAIDFGPSAACTAAPISGVDQRGASRNVDGNSSASSNECDSGAYEYLGGMSVATDTPTATNTPTNTPTDTSTPTATNTPTDTPTPTATNTPTNTPTDTSTPTATNTPTDTSTPTATNTPTNTPVPPTNTPTATPTNTPVAGVCLPDAGVNEMTTILGQGMGSNTSGKGVVKIVVPNPNDVVSIYGQLAGKEQRSYKYARFLRPNGTYINDKTQESPAYRNSAVFWFGEYLTPANSAHWRARLIGAPTNKPFVQRAFLLYPTYETATAYVNVFELFDVSSENHVYWDAANGWIPTQQQIIPMAAPLQPVDLTVMVAVVDNDRDTRPFKLTITAGGVSSTVMVNGPTNGDLLNLVQVTLNNVPAGTSQIVLDLESPDEIGDSVAMVGMTAHYPCVTSN